MWYRNISVVVFLPMLLAQGCAGVQTFPDNGGTTLTASDEFGTLVAKPDLYQGRAVRLAGRIVGVETTDEGTTILAEWLPFPEPGQYGPAKAAKSEGERFTLHYPGKLDPKGTWYGNKFVVAGAMKGTTKITTVGGSSTSVPHIEARCLRVWKTGASDLSDAAPDVEQTGFPPVQQTYCSNG